MTKKILYIDCFSGISGDMFIGALLDLGVDFVSEFKKIPLNGYSIKVAKEKRKGISGTRFIVDVKEPQKERSLKDILALIEKSRLTKSVKEKSSYLFKLLGVAEAKVHGVDINNIHFHEVGAVDSIIDIIGAAAGIEKLGIDEIYSSKARLSNATAPATLELLKDIPVLGVDRDVEMVTPTGAVFLKGLAKKIQKIPEMRIDRIGYGIGTRDDRDLPNVLRVILGEMTVKNDPVYILETNIDDMNPQRYGILMNRLFKKGALDVFWTPVQMKKNRPGILVTVICNESKLNDLVEVFFKETTTFGVRYYEVERRILDREIKKMKGRRVKVGKYKGEVLKVMPEYEDWKEVYSPSR